VEKISEISTTWIARYELSNSQKSMFWPCKNPGSCTSQGHISIKKDRKWWLPFGFIPQGKLATRLKKFRSFGIVQHIGNNSKLKVENASKY